MLYNCQICENTFEKVTQLNSHIQHHHKEYNSKSYYDRFVKKPNEGICKICNKTTKFRGMMNGYQKYCNNKCAWQDPAVKEKRSSSIAMKTDLEKKEWRRKNIESRKKNNNGKTISDAVLEKRYNISVSSFKKYFEKCDCMFVNYTTNPKRIVSFRCNKCGHETSYVRSLIDRMARNEDYGICHHCNNRKSVSMPEKELHKYVLDICENEKYKISDRQLLNGKEIDIVLYDRNLAFEFDGLYWHNENVVNNDYHLMKTELCEEKGFQLIHIFEDEWIYKQDIVKSRIKGILGVNEKIFARKTECKEITYEESKEFLEKNHIQGSCVSAYRYGLFYRNELVAVMTFGKSRFTNEFELLRFANKLNTNVIGGASKLFKHFLNAHPEITEVVSYADRRWSKGNLYEKLGFSFISKTAVSYAYVVNHVRENRIKYQKHKLVKMGYDPNKTEHEIMQELGYPRIYDCGNLKYVFSRKLV